MFYQKLQTLKELQTQKVYSVLERPNENNPNYWLKPFDGSEIVILHRLVVHDRSLFVPQHPYLPHVTKSKYPRMEYIEECKTGVRSVVVGLPFDHRLQETLEPVYLLQNSQGIRWAVLQVEVESDAYQPIPVKDPPVDNR